jgi:release factor glutamine methyltransferase
MTRPSGSSRKSAPDSVAAALARGRALLRAAGVSEVDANAELLLAHLLGTGRGGVIVRGAEPLPQALAERYAAGLARRCRREPLQHVTGEQEFHGSTFRIDARALIPRPETEGLVLWALALDLPRGSRVADLGTGSGCIAVSLALARPDLRLVALDRSAEALDLARENAAAHGVLERIEFQRGDFAAPPAAWREMIDLVVCNPPYVSAQEWEALEPEVRDHDPRCALVAGSDGFAAHDVVIPSAAVLLPPGGPLLLEIGCGQSAGVADRLARSGFEAIEVRPDLRGIPRVVLARRRRP